MSYNHHQQQNHPYSYGSGKSSTFSGHRVANHQDHRHRQQASDHMSVGSSHYSRGSSGSSQNSLQVDEAYKRLGQKLSARAHGDLPLSTPQVLSNLGLTPNSVFARYDDHDVLSQQETTTTINYAGAVAESPGSLKRTNKVAKTGYSDHGDHNKTSSSFSKQINILRKINMNAKELFALWQADTDQTTPAKGKKKRQSPTQSMYQRYEDLSPQRFAFSQLALDSSSSSSQKITQNDGGTQQKQPHQQQTSNQIQENLIQSGRDKKHGLLSAVMESSSHTSSQSNLRTSENESKASSSIATKSSLETKSSLTSSFRTLPQGKCLTQPSDPVSNDGLDNADGNLIVHEDDIIRLSRNQVHVLTEEEKKRMKHVNHADFRIQSLLGQGTFAQVFQCIHLQSGKLVAIKIVKNKTAYTRQAAVEIDVFRALTKKQEKAVSKSKDEASSGRTNWDNMVDLVCYFMYKNHLCLVFELLGLNLYEVLKRRQFRGLPLTVVRRLVQQAVGGIVELAKKSIVHCDLKPENILLVTEDDVKSVVSARHSVSSTDKKKSLLSSSMEKAPKKSELTKAMTTGKKPGESTSGLSKALEGNRIATPESDDDVSRSNSLGTAGTKGMSEQNIKLIDFGSACFEGQTTHTYIQSRFYRSPEVLIGLPYDSAIDMWSLGCVAAELFLGLPILPGVHEHDQLGRVSEMIADLPTWMLDQGSKASKFFIKYMSRSDDQDFVIPNPIGNRVSPSPKPLHKWRIKSQQEYISSLSQSEIRKKGGLAKLEKQPANRYFKKKKLSDIIMHKGQSGQAEEKEDLDLFIHFLYGLLDPDPWKRWTAYQAAQHPFITGEQIVRPSEGSVPDSQNSENHANSVVDMYWEPPLDPGICRRKLLSVQKVREKQSSKKSYSNSRAQNSMQMRGHSADGTYMSDSQASGDYTHSLSSNEEMQLVQRTAQQTSLADTQMIPQPPMQISSSSLVDYPTPASLASASLSGSAMYSHHSMSGPQSYSDILYSGAMPTSFNNIDFAYALQRPGVVPTGESLSSSGDTNPNFQQQYFHPQQNQYLMGSYGVDPSFQQGGIQQFGSNTQADFAGQMQYVPPTNFGIQGSNFNNSGMLQQAQNPVNPSMSNEILYGDAQAYFQQQHAALQQQQLLLQQQQAALALQQQQLQAYGINPVPFNTNQPTLNEAQFAQTGGGYYYVASADANPMNQGVANYGVSSPHGMSQQQNMRNGHSLNNNHGMNPPNSLH